MDKPSVATLIDCGCQRSCINPALFDGLTDLIEILPSPLVVEYFDRSRAYITQKASLTIQFPDGTVHDEELLVTTTPTDTPIVLGLAWLRRWNPLIDWATLTLAFKTTANAANIPLQLVPAAPAFKISEDTIGAPANTATATKFTVATIAPSTTTDKTAATTNLPTTPTPQTTNTTGDAPPREDPTPNSRPQTPSTSEPPRSFRRKGHRKKANVPVTRTSSGTTDPSAPKIALIGAAALKVLERAGETIQLLYYSPTTNDSPDVKANAVNVTGSPETAQDRVPAQYRDFTDVFSEEVAKELPPRRDCDHKIELEEGASLPAPNKLYNMSQTELQTLREYIDQMVDKGFIRPSKSPIGAPVLFTKKKDGGLRLCVDYRGLNRLTRKNRYPIPRIDTLIDRLSSAKVFTKIDLRDGYHNVRIAEGHEWKTAFRTRYGAFEYLVMPFGLTNAPATFQNFMNDIFHDLADDFVVVYLDDVLIYSKNEQEHVGHVREVLERLRANDLHAKPEKCSFHVDSVEYLGVIVSPDGVAMDPSKVQVILDWPTPRTVKELQSFLGFANFYRRFIDNYSGITGPLTQLLRKNTPWRWNDKRQAVFDLLKNAFTTAPILRHFDPDHPIILECDASDYAIAAILSQVDPTTQEVRPVAFHARTMLPAELNYDIYDKELLAIHEGFKQWRAYLEGARHQIQVFSDHCNLQYFTTTKQLSRRQARWSEYLSSFDYTIYYRPGRLGAKPDALTRRADVYPKKADLADANAINNRIAIPPEQLRAHLLLDEDLLLNRIRQAPRDEYFGAKSKEGGDSFTLSPDGKLLLREGKIYVPDHDSLRFDILQAHHDHKLRGHPGVRKTLQLIQRTFYWPRLRRDVNHYVRACHACARAKTPRHKPFGFLKPLPIGERPWMSISMDHIDSLPLSEGYDSILVVVCRLSKQGIFIPAKTTDDATDLARRFIQSVFSKHGLPADIISDRGHLFISKFWSSLCDALDITSNLSTAYHPETDGQTERVNQSLEQYLRLFVNYQQDDWVQQLPIAEFVYNNTPHSATGVSPFFANKGYHPRLTIQLDDIPSHEAHRVAADLKALHQHLREQIQVANEAYANFADRKRDPTPSWPLGTLVWLDLRNVKTKRPAKKLDFKRHGPFPITAQVSSHAYRLKLPATMKGIHDVFHVSLLEKVADDPYPQRQQPPPPPIEIDGEDHYVVADIVDSRKRRGRVYYLVRWAGYGPEDDTWEPVEMLEGSRELLEEFHAAYPNKPSALDSLKPPV